MEMKKLTHIDKNGRAVMVDVSTKKTTHREAVAQGSVYMKPETLRLIEEKAVPKGDVISVAKVAGIMAAKKTSEFIPMCHPLNLTSVKVDIEIDEEGSKIDINAKVKTVGQTGVEMEALTAVSAAALTVYDMCKAADKEMTISGITLLEKRGGRSGEYKRNKNIR